MTNTTREGFELPEMPNFMRAWNPITVNQVHAYGQICFKAAKADELAFLEGLSWARYSEAGMRTLIASRIRELKGESRE